MSLASRAATAGLLLLLAPAAAAQTPAAMPADSVRYAVVSNPHAQVRRELFEGLLPVRSVREITALDPAFRRDLATGTLTFRARAGGLGGVQEPVFVVDGVRRLGGPMGASTLGLLGAPDVPFAAVSRIEALGGFVPADIGEAGGGVVRIQTHDGSGGFGARLEGFSSDATDATGARLASATVRAPFGGGLGGFSLTGELRRAGDAVPSAGRALRLTDAAYARLQDAPQALRVRDAAGVRLVAFPTSAALASLAAGRPFTVPDALAALGLGAGTTLDNDFPVDAADALTDADLERVQAQDNPLREASAAAHLVLMGSGTARIRAGGVFQFRTADATAPTPAEAFGRRLANRDGLSRQRDSRASVFFAAERVPLAAGIEATARLGADVAGSLLRPAAFLDDVADALSYGDADDAVFATAQRSFTFATGRGYVPVFANDGPFGPSAQPFTGFAQPGAAASVYDRQSALSLQASGSLARAVGAHRLSLGGEVESQTFRRFTLDGLALATYANDGNGISVPGFPTGVDRYDQLSFDALRVPVRQVYGYTFNGLDTVDSESVAGYFQDATGRRADTSVAPFRPLTAAGYVRDEMRLGPVELDAGLRIERYDARATTLFDPFSTVPIQRAGSLASAPTGIGGDFAVYYADNGASLVGFRDRQGQFYDAAGAPASADAILQERRGAPRQTAGSTEEVFAPTQATTRLQPRVGVRVQASPRVLVTGYAMRASRRPDPSLYVPFSSYEQLSQAPLPGNADLRPEDVRAAGVGVEVQAAPGVVLGAAGFGRQTRGLPERRTLVGGLPEYGGVFNGAARDEAGLDLTARLVAARGVKVFAGYTLARARDVSPSGVENVFGESAASAPSEGDVRHALDLAAEARTPASAGLLGGVGVGVVVQAQSGLPYTALLPNDRFSVFDPFTPNVSGTVGGARLPWTVQADVRLEKRVALGAGAVTAFVWVENVLGTRNALALYRSTGQPDADGFAATPNGQQVLDTPGRQALYAGYIGGPANVGGRQSTGAPFVYGQPRQVRLGVVLGL